MRHARHGAPRQVLAAAVAALGQAGMEVEAVSAAVTSAPLGASRRHYANAVAVIRASQAPEALLAALQRIERRFGRRPRGARWRARVLDLDIVLWSGGPWAAQRLTIPHPQFRRREFVLTPARVVAPMWRDPITRLTLRQLHARLTRAKPLA